VLGFESGQLMIIHFPSSTRRGAGMHGQDDNDTVA